MYMEISWETLDQKILAENNIIIGQRLRQLALQLGLKSH